jgi:hypothetical protein
VHIASDFSEVRQQEAAPISTSHVLAAIIVLAIVLRATSALYQANEITPLPGVFDQISYHTLACRVVEGHGFTVPEGWWPATAANQPTAHWSYLYVLFLAAVYGFFGQAPLAARLIQAVLTGWLQTWLTFRISTRIFGPRVGLVSAALSAVYAYFLLYGSALVTEAFYIVALLWTLDIATGLAQDTEPQGGFGKKRTWAALGLAFGLAVLLRQVVLLTLPLTLGWVGWMLARKNAPSARAARLLPRTGLAVLLVLTCVAPWTIRNYMVFDQFVPLNTNAGFAFFWGNHPVHGVQFVPVLHGEGTYSRLIPNEVKQLNEAAMDRELFRRGLGFVREEPVRYLRLSLSRIREYFKFWPEADSGAISNWARMLSFGLYLPLFVAGLGISLWRPHKKAAVASLLVLFCALYSLIHILSWTLIRYRLPIDAVLMPFAGLTTVWILNRINVPNQLLRKEEQV